MEAGKNDGCVRGWQGTLEVNLDLHTTHPTGTSTDT